MFGRKHIVFPLLYFPSPHPVLNLRSSQINWKGTKGRVHVCCPEAMAEASISKQLFPNEWLFFSVCAILSLRTEGGKKIKRKERSRKAHPGYQVKPNALRSASESLSLSCFGKTEKPRDQTLVGLGGNWRG